MGRIHVYDLAQVCLGPEELHETHRKYRYSLVRHNYRDPSARGRVVKDIQHFRQA